MNDMTAPHLRPHLADEALAEHEAVKTTEWPDEDEPRVTDRNSTRLRDFEKVAEALWPFVRSFGLCGAHPTAIAAVVALGKLLGHTDASQSTVIEIGDKVRAETIHEVADKVAELLRGKILSKEIPGIVDKIREL